MHIFLYEWVTGGGLVEQSGKLPQSLLTEGRAMLRALAADFCAIEGARVTVLKDIRLDDLPLPDCEVVEVFSESHHHQEFERLAAEANHTLVVAPEIDNVLVGLNERARLAGGSLLASGHDFVHLASDKQASAEQLKQHGIPVPEAIVLDADEERLPKDFAYPGVIKPVHGAGSQHTLLVSSAQDEPPPYPWPRRLEKFCPGEPVSVAFLCGQGHRMALAACRQHLSSDGRFTYTGGSLLLENDLARRGVDLATKALDAMPTALGYVGVDLVLGKMADGSEDVVIEINPRITTSYVGLRAATEDNLAAAIIENIAGNLVQPTFAQSSLEFLVDGTIR